MNKLASYEIALTSHPFWNKEAEGLTDEQRSSMKNRATIGTLARHLLAQSPLQARTEFISHDPVSGEENTFGWHENKGLVDFDVVPLATAGAVSAAPKGRRLEAGARTMGGGTIGSLGGALAGGLASGLDVESPLMNMGATIGEIAGQRVALNRMK